MKDFSVCFVCTGNICRSPMARVIFSEMIKSANLESTVDSAGISGWHEGEPMDLRAREVLISHNYLDVAHRAKRLPSDAFKRYTHIICMDKSHLDFINNINKKLMHSNVMVSLLLSFVPNSASLNVPDPYYEDKDFFEEVFQIIELGCRHLLNFILNEIR